MNDDPALTKKVLPRGQPKEPRGNPVEFQKRPEQKTLIWKSFFLFGGVSSLFVWNAVISLNEYWSQKFSDSVTSYYSFTYMLGSWISFFAYDITNSCLQFQYQMTIFPTIMA
jgi:hypothetical protein